MIEHLHGFRCWVWARHDADDARRPKPPPLEDVRAFEASLSAREIDAEVAADQWAGRDPASDYTVVGTLEALAARGLVDVEWARYARSVHDSLTQGDVS